MKILVISHMYPSSFNSIAGIFVHKQVKNLVDLGYEVKVVSPVPYVPFPMNKFSTKLQAYCDIPKQTVIDGIEVYYPRYVEIPRGIMFHRTGYFMYKGIRETIDELYSNFKFDIIHSHVILPDGLAAVLVNNKYKKPHIVTVHGQDFQYTINKNKVCRDKLFYVMNNVDKIITVSNKLKNVIKDEEIKSKMVVINNGIDEEDYGVNEKSVYDADILNEKCKIILSVSNLNKTKGIDLGIMAAQELIKKYPNINIKYYIVGSGDEEDNLKSLVKKLNMEQNVKFFGRRPHDEAMKYMEACDIFCLPSWQEGFGVAYIEAMAHGKPVIGVRGEGIEDVIVDKDNGFLVRPHNVEDIVDVLSGLIENPKEAKKVGLKGKDTVINNLTWATNAKKTVEVYNSVISEEKDAGGF